MNYYNNINTMISLKNSNLFSIEEDNSIIVQLDNLLYILKIYNKLFVYALLIFFVLFSNISLYSQPRQITETSDHTFFVLTKIDSVNNRIILSWDNDTNAVQYYIKKKLKYDDTFEDDYYAILEASQLTFIDSNVTIGYSYEYGLEKWCGHYSAWNYINAGWSSEIVEYRGRILLLIDSTIAPHLSAELNRLKLDLIGDGWLPKFKIVPRAEDFSSKLVEQNKQIILDEFRANSDSLRAVLLIGRVAVPYSGNFTIDGHRPDHEGAWPSDIYYSVVSDSWTDSIANNSGASQSRQHNIPNDGKYDNSFIPNDAVLEIGRIDMYNLPAFYQSEIELLRNYFEKNHNYRNNISKFPQKAVIDDKFKMYSNEAFASNAWMNFSALFGKENIDTASIRYHLLENRYLFSYGCNSGGTNSCYLVGYTDEFTHSPPLSAFYIAFGSYFGDMDFEDNFLKAALASSASVVASFWMGRPFWHLHHLSLGDCLGYSLKITQNNTLLYESTARYGHRMVHTNLLGDPTLRIHYINPVDNLTINHIDNSNGLVLHWDYTDINEDFQGFLVYRSNSLNNKFVRISDNLIKNNYFHDFYPVLGKNIYLVRAVKKQHTPTGSYMNQSQGKFVELDFYPIPNNSKDIDAYAAPNPATDFINIVVHSKLTENIDVLLYDTQGKLIKNIYNNYFDNESIIIRFDLKDNNNSNLAIGTYYIRVKIGNKATTVKFAIVK